MLGFGWVIHWGKFVLGFGWVINWGERYLIFISWNISWKQLGNHFNLLHFTATSNISLQVSFLAPARFFDDRVAFQCFWADWATSRMASPMARWWRMLGMKPSALYWTRGPKCNDLQSSICRCQQDALVNKHEIESTAITTYIFSEDLLKCMWKVLAKFLILLQNL